MKTPKVAHKGNRVRRTWFNPHRCANSPTMAALCDELRRMVENFEMHDRCPNDLRRRRRRRDSSKKPDATNFKMLFEAVISDLVYEHLAQNSEDGHTLINRSTGYLGSPTRYSPSYLGKVLPHILDVLADPSLGFIEQIKGEHVHGHNKGFTTMIKPTSSLIRRAEHIGFDDITRRPGEEIVILKDGRRDKRTFVNYTDDDHTLALRAEVRRINEHLEAADINFDEMAWDRPVDLTQRRLSRYFTYGSFQLGGRLFGGWWMALPRKVRNKSLFIDDEPVVTLDYAQMALKLAYSSLKAPLPATDGYTIPGLEDHRTGVKRLFNSMLFPRLAHWKLAVSSKIRSQLPGEWSDEQLIATVKRRHPALADVWYTDIGHRLQNTESNILVDVLLTLIERGITALPVHDAVIVKASAEAEVREVMLEVFEKHVGIAGQVEAE